MTRCHRSLRQNTVQALIDRGLVSPEQLKEAQDRCGVPRCPAASRAGRVQARRPDRRQRAFAEAAGSGVRRARRSFSSTRALWPACPPTRRAAWESCRSGGTGSRLVVATSDPTNVIALDDLRVLTGVDIKIVYAARRDIEDKLAKVYRAEGELGDISQDMVEHVDRRVRAISHAGRLRRRRADRSLRQPADQPGDRRPSLRHPRRADRDRPAGSLPHRRRAARDDALAEARSRPA